MLPASDKPAQTYKLEHARTYAPYMLLPKSLEPRIIKSCFKRGGSAFPFARTDPLARLLHAPQNTKFHTPLHRQRARFLASMASVERVTDHLEKPELDDRSYRVIRLPNKLEALLVHDPDTDKASASVNVNVGSFSDADDMPGMAHAVEHLLFMGTKKVEQSAGLSAISDPTSTLSKMRTASI